MEDNKLKQLIKKIIGNKNYNKLIYFKKLFQYSRRDGIFYCPCCNKRFNEWKSFRLFHWDTKFNERKFDIRSDKCICPICNSVPRQRIEANWFESNYILNSINNNEIHKCKERILVWSGEESLLRYLRRRKLRYVTADLYYKGADYNVNIEESGFNDKQFDLIICNHVLEHVNDVSKALTDTYRILKETGIALIMVPMDANMEKTLDMGKLESDDDRRMIYGQSDHVRLFGKDFVDILNNAGFHVDNYDGTKKCPQEIAPLIAPANYDSNILFVCKKY